MQNQENCYKNVWILSGTSDGPLIANRLLDFNYSVFASVLTYKAGQAYIENPRLHIITGKLNNKDQIINFINKNKITCARHHLSKKRYEKKKKKKKPRCFLCARARLSLSLSFSSRLVARLLPERRGRNDGRGKEILFCCRGM